MKNVVGRNSLKAIICAQLIASFLLSGCAKSDDDFLLSDEAQESQTLKAGNSLWNPPSTAIFIDPNNTSDKTRNGTISHPFISFQEIKWKDNIVIALKRGTTLVTSGIVLSANGVTLASYGTSTKRPYIKHTATTGHAITTNWKGGTNITIRDLEVYSPNGVSCVIFRDNSRNVKLINCSLHGSQWGVRALNYLSGVYISNCEIYDIKCDGIFIQASNNIDIGYNYIHHVNRFYVTTSTSTSVASGDGIQFEGCNNWRVHHNKIDRTDTGNKFCFISNNPNQNNGVIENNHFLGPKTNGFAIYIHDGNNITARYNYIDGPSNSPFYTHASNVKVYYNIFRKLKGPLFADGSGNNQVFNNLFYDMPMAIQGKNITAVNNILDLFSITSTRFKVTNLKENNNLFVLGGPTSRSFAGDPLYRDEAKGNYRLRAGSPCINKGAEVGVTWDLDGTTAPFAGARDIGPYEYRSF